MSEDTDDELPRIAASSYLNTAPLIWSFIHNMDDIQVTPGVTLGSLGVVELDERMFEIASVDPDHPLTEHKAKGIAESLRRQDMFDEIRVEPREEADRKSV